MPRSVRPAVSSTIVLVLGLAGAPAATAVGDGVPAQWAFELQARTNLIVNDSGFNLPPGASFNSITVDMNDAAEVTFRVQVVPGRDGMSVWFGSGGNGALLCEGENDFDAIVSDPKLNATGTIAWSQFFGSAAANGVYTCDPATGVETRVTAGPLGASSWGTPEINDAGLIGYRAGFGSGQAFVSFDSPSFAVHATEVGIDVASPYDFLFTPSFDNLRRIAGVVRRAGQPAANREIRMFTAAGESTLIAQNTTLLPTSPYVSFDNAVGLNDSGQVAFIATLAGGVRGVFRSDGVNTVEIAREGVGAVTDIEFFAPAINNAGLVVFRGADATGQAIFAGDGTTLNRVVGKGDVIATDLGMAQVGQHDSSPVFGGGVAVNAEGDIAFTAGLHPNGMNQEEWGTGVFVAYAGAAPLPDALFASSFEN